MLVKTLLAWLMKSPHVIESGSANGWSWQKWSNGIADAYWRGMCTFGVSATVGASLRYSEHGSVVNDLPNIFIENPEAYVNGVVPNSNWGTFANGQPDVANNRVFISTLMWTGGGNTNADISIHIRGKWKLGGVVKLLRTLICQEVAYGY